MSEKLLEYNRKVRGFVGYETDRPNQLNRYMGGHQRTNSPLITGYFYFILEPPEGIFKEKKKDFTDFIICTTESFTPPNRNITKAEVIGLGGIKMYVPTHSENSGTFSVTLREYRNAPIFQGLHLWASLINPYFGGHTKIKAKYEDYKGTALLVQMKPTMAEWSERYQEGECIPENDIEQVMYFDGVFPESDPYEGFRGDITTNDSVSVNISFSFDGAPMTKEVFKLDDAAKILNTYGIRNYK